MVAGEASGDLHAARLLSELRSLRPGVRAFGMGGEELEEAGLERVADSGVISVVGIVEALKILPQARRIFRRLLAEVERRGTRVAVLVDFPDFNLRLAKKLHARGVRVVYYISPQMWAWRRRRVRTVARVVERMLVLFPFEVDFYRKHGVEVEHVGHPLVDEVPELEQVWEEGPPTDGPYRVALLPGSRHSEVEALLPTMLESVRALAGELPVQARLVRAPTVARSLVAGMVELADLPVEIVDPGVMADDARRQRFRAVAGSHLALCASGTATLEVGLLGTPMVMLYRMAPWTYRLGRLLVRVPHYSLVNLVLERAAIPELIQADAEPGRVAREVARLLRDPERIAGMRRDLAELRPRLGDSGASRRAAEAVARLLPGAPPMAGEERA